jgi:hypothetical protein
MEPQIIRLRRRKSGSSGPPSTLNEGELGFNEVNDTLYYGKGNDNNGNATSIISIAGKHTEILKDHYISKTETLTDVNEYLIININGKKKAIKLFDVV